MKKRLLTSVVSAVLMAISMSSQANVIISKEKEAKLIRVCKALKSDSQVKLHHALRQYRFSHHDVAKNLMCNGMNSLAYAIQHRAYNNAAYLADQAKMQNPLQMAAKETNKKKKTISQ